MSNKKTLASDIDGNWKGLIKVKLLAFIRFFARDIYEQLHPDYPPVLQLQEMKKIKASIKGRKMVDILIKATLKTGEIQHLFVHIELQSEVRADFDKRMFQYYSLIFLRHNDANETPISSLAIVMNPNLPAGTGKFERSAFNTNLSFGYNVFHVSPALEAELLASDEPFALACLATIYVFQSRNDESKRLAYLKKIAEILVKKPFDYEMFQELLTFAERMLRLSAERSLEYEKYFLKLVKDTPMGRSSIDFPDLDYKPTRDRLAKIVLNGKTLEQYEAEQKAEAKAEAEAEKQLLIFKMFKDFNIKASAIAQSTGKTVEEIEQIIKTVEERLKKEAEKK